ncbi:MAG: hypothetical protein LUC18_04570 [Porphyromonadaceae bacterium]|nr:hypothetical protein [Porphyromonadaceae bacterium]
MTEIDNTRADYGVSGEIPAWILPISYIVITAVLGLSVLILHIIPHDRSLSGSIDVHFTGDSLSAITMPYGEMILPDNGIPKVGSAVNVSLRTERESRIYYSARIDSVYYDSTLDSHVAIVAIPDSGIIDISDSHDTSTLKGEAEVVLENDNMLAFVWNRIRNLFGNAMSVIIDRMAPIFGR